MQNHIPHEDAHILNPGIWEYATLYVKRDFADRLWLRTLRWGDGKREISLQMELGVQSN